jgi:hypothetical protein
MHTTVVRYVVSYYLTVPCHPSCNHFNSTQLTSTLLSLPLPSPSPILHHQFAPPFLEPNDDTHYSTAEPEMSSVGNRGQSQELFDMFKSLNNHGTGRDYIMYMYAMPVGSVLLVHACVLVLILMLSLFFTSFLSYCYVT